MARASAFDGADADSVDRNSPIPLYHQLKRAVIAHIEAEGLSAGDRLPGDRELGEAYSVSRTVVRHALSELEYEGVIERRRGKGTFVAPSKTAQTLVQSLAGLFQDVAARGGDVTSDVRRLEVVPADREIAARLDVPVDTPVIVVERLRFVDGEPWVFTISHIPYELAPTLLDVDLSHRSLYGTLEEAFGLELVRARRTAGATAASARLADDLGISAGAPVLVLRNVSYGPSGRPFETFVAYHRSDRSTFEVELIRPDDSKTDRSDAS
jgi:GntR family transcriptional regulator